MQKELDVIEKLNAEIAEIKPKFEAGKKQMAEFTDKLAENQKKTQMLKVLLTILLIKVDILFQLGKKSMAMVKKKINTLA